MENKPIREKAFVVCVQLSDLTDITSSLSHLSEKLYDRLNGSGGHPRFSRTLRKEGKEVELLPHSHYIISGNYEMDDVLFGVETAAHEMLDEWCHRTGRPVHRLPMIVIEAKDQKQPARGLNLEPIQKPSAPS